MLPQTNEILKQDQTVEINLRTGLKPDFNAWIKLWIKSSLSTG